jgi:hypothetical protein
VLVDGQALESLDRGFGGALRLQVTLEEVDIVVEPLQVLFLDRGDALEDLGGVGTGSGVVNGLEVLAGGLRSTKVRLSTRSRKRCRLVPGTWRSTSNAHLQTEEQAHSADVVVARWKRKVRFRKEA